MHRPSFCLYICVFSRFCDFSHYGAIIRFLGLWCKEIATKKTESLPDLPRSWPCGARQLGAKAALSLRAQLLTVVSTPKKKEKKVATKHVVCYYPLWGGYDS